MIKTRTSVVPYLDASALSAFMLEGDESRQKVETLIAKGATVSALCIDEMLWVARKLGKKDYAGLTHELMMHPAIEFIEVRSTTWLRASELMEKYNLKPRDAMHAAIMHEEGATTILSNDPDFDKIPGITRIAV